MDSNTPKDFIGSIERAMNLLMLFENDHTSELSIAAMSNLLELPKTTLHRIASTLLKGGFLEQNPSNKKYRLGKNIYLLGNRYLEMWSLERVARMHLPMFSKTLGESVSISVLDKTESVIINKIDGTYFQPLASHIGVRNALHCSASGKLFLGMMEPEQRRHLIHSLTPLQKKTPFTITDPEELMRNVEMVSELGYVYECEEVTMGQICIAAPIFDHQNKICAALTASGIKRHVGQKNIDAIGRKLRAAGIKMSQEIGCLRDFSE